MVRIVKNRHELSQYTARKYFKVKHNIYDRDFVYETHYHRSIEVTYVVEGRKVQYTNSRKGFTRIEATKGTLLLVNSGLSHSIEVDRGLEGIVLLIDLSIFPYFYPQTKSFYFSLNKNETIKKRIINLMLELAKANDAQDQVYVNICVLNIIHTLMNQCLDEEHLFIEKHDHENELLTDIKDYIDLHYQSRITLGELCREFSYNKSYLSNLFKKYYGVSIFEYLKKRRLEEAVYDLKHTTSSCEDIAFRNGFASLQSFYVAFKQAYHMTPNQYRKSK